MEGYANLRVDWSLLSSRNSHEKLFCQFFRKYECCPLVEKNNENDCFLAIFRDTTSFAQIHSTYIFRSP